MSRLNPMLFVLIGVALYVLPSIVRKEHPRFQPRLRLGERSS